MIEVNVVGAMNDTPNYPDPFDGTDSAAAIATAGLKFPICRPIVTIPVGATTSDLPICVRASGPEAILRRCAAASAFALRGA